MTYQWRNDFFISKTVTHAFTIWIYQCNYISINGIVAIKDKEKQMFGFIANSEGVATIDIVERNYNQTWRKLFPLYTHCTTKILHLHVYIFVSDLFIIPKRFFLFFIMVCFSIYVYCGLQKLYCFERNLFFVFSFVPKNIVFTYQIAYGINIMSKHNLPKFQKTKQEHTWKYLNNVICAPSFVL